MKRYWEIMGAKAGAGLAERFWRKTMHINEGYLIGILPVFPSGTNSTMFTECCSVAICNHQSCCPQCGRKVIGCDTESNYDVDHINHNGLDNRRCNIRICTPSQNGGNQRLKKGFTSKYRGVSWNKSGNIRVAVITVNRKTKRIGRFKNEIDAARAYGVAALLCFGEYAALNSKYFPRDV